MAPSQVQHEESDICILRIMEMAHWGNSVHRHISQGYIMGSRGRGVLRDMKGCKLAHALNKPCYLLRKVILKDILTPSVDSYR